MLPQHVSQANLSTSFVELRNQDGRPLPQSILKFCHKRIKVIKVGLHIRHVCVDDLLHSRALIFRAMVIIIDDENRDAVSGVVVRIEGGKY